MPYDYSITIGTTGRGTWNSGDGGDSWILQRKTFFPPESPIVRALTLHPHEPNTIYAGGDLGVHRSRNNGREWELLGTPGDIKNVWAISIDPTNPDIIYAGTSPSEVYKSLDGGHRWLNLDIPDKIELCAVGTPRVTQIAIDPDDTRIVWAGVEQDGLRRSLDGGDTWAHVKVFDEDDIHSVVITRTNPKRILVLTPTDLYVSTDMGESWEPMNIHGVMTRENQGNYSRWIVAKPDNPEVIFLGTGNSNVGDAGNVFRSTDSGRTWDELNFPFYPNSTVYDIGVNPADPDRVVACALNGEVWASEDSGDSWRRIERIFGEVICVAWQPNSEDVQLKQTSSGTYAGFGGKVHTQDTREAHGLSR